MHLMFCQTTFVFFLFKFVLFVDGLFFTRTLGFAALIHQSRFFAAVQSNYIHALYGIVVTENALHLMI